MVEVQEVYEISRQKIGKNKRRKRSMKRNEVEKSSFQPKMTRAMSKRLEKHKQQDRGFVNIAKRPRTRYSNPKSKLTPWWNSIGFYDSLESKEMEAREHSSSNRLPPIVVDKNKEISPILNQIE